MGHAPDAARRLVRDQSRTLPYRGVGGQAVYIVGWVEERLTRRSRGVTLVQKDVIQFGFRPGNLHMALGGFVVFAAGHTDGDGN